MILSDGETQGPDPRHKGSHAFPPLKKASIPPETPTAEPDDCFRPLYNAAPTAGVVSHRKGIGVACTGKDRISEDCARKEAYNRGLEAGKQDACSLVQREAAPQITSFADAFNQWNAAMTRIEEKSQLQIFKMAVAIAEKIVGAPPQCCTGRLETMKEDLKAYLHKSYQLEFMLNQNDLDALSHLTACADVHWGHWEYIAATPGPEMQSGTLAVQTDSRPPSDLEALLRALDASLAEVSTK